MSAVVEETTVAEETPELSPPAVVDVEALLAPIPGDNPVGENLQYSAYDEMREARRAEESLPSGDWQRDVKAAEWPKVIDLTTSALASKTKDLQICAWLVEALVELYGFVGLRDGLTVMRGLHEQYWDGLYPPIDEGDLDARANAVSKMDALLEIPLKKVPLTKSGSAADYSYLHWEESTKFEIPDNLDSLDSEAFNRISELKAQAEAEGRTTGDAWRKAKNATERDFYEDTYSIVNQCWDQFQALDQVMDEKFDRQTPGLGTIKKTLDAIRSLVEKLVKESRILHPRPGEGDEESGEPGADGEVGASATGGSLRSRADALRRLAEVAQYFQRTEPHSPVAYLVQRAIKWGQMPLEVWLADVIKDGAVLGQLKETLGLDTPLVDDSNG